MPARKRLITLRPAAPADDWAVARLFAALHAHNAELDERFTLSEQWERVLHEHLAHVRETGHGLTLLAWEDSTPVGLLMMGRHSDTPLFYHRYWAELLALYVTPELRGSRLARQLINAAKIWAADEGYERIQLYVTATNVPARRFYERCGFRVVQEIMRIELGGTELPPPDDPASEAVYRHGEDLLSTSSFHLWSDEDEA